MYPSTAVSSTRRRWAAIHAAAIAGVTAGGVLVLAFVAALTTWLSGTTDPRDATDATDTPTGLAVVGILATIVAGTLAVAHVFRTVRWAATGTAAVAVAGVATTFVFAAAGAVNGSTGAILTAIVAALVALAAAVATVEISARADP